MNEILLGNIKSAGLNTNGLHVIQEMATPALGMLGSLVPPFFHYPSRVFIKTAKSIDNNDTGIKQPER
ncbi:hypothetical protein [Neisseria iguanae]|uniref:Uncharacterized protein n=1 Tax=Neisseria iguanae TaxID=90242 RepID=A0A2P7TYZ5_9NEIS|nr:hypothetical protein [Neisseria iguanae]PSJ79911.1 hypothetical protein C7N83_09490 [Neisseria iguanae]